MGIEALESQGALNLLNGGALSAAELAGKTILFVNVASRCGLTPQYEGLVALYRERKASGLVVVGVPCNQFMGQEPGTADEIREFCSVTYGVDFPLLAKQDVNGDGRSPLYQWLIDSEASEGGDIQWNFEKFVVDGAGEVRGRFAPATPPADPGLLGLLDTCLG